MKQFYFTRFFEEIIEDLKEMWKGMKKIISLNNFKHTFPTNVTINNETFTYHYDIANTFHNYFADASVDTRWSIRFSIKKYFDYLRPLNVHLLFITLNDSVEVFKTMPLNQCP